MNIFGGPKGPSRGWSRKFCLSQVKTPELVDSKERPQMVGPVGFTKRGSCQRAFGVGLGLVGVVLGNVLCPLRNVQNLLTRSPITSTRFVSTTRRIIIWRSVCFRGGLGSDPSGV